ncbi:MAG: DegT/DnrJ/EryC1/StrS family aminotransferase [Anaerolineales bacterium]|nr:DegT/DnrJ/EryC1/StrS family aminotransferase [Anaerolineales bacterium]
MQWRVPLADLDFDQAETQAVLQVLNSRWLSMGTVTQEFERRFAAMVGAQYAFAVSNATQALHLACLALGIGAGDEVIVPSLSFVATANCVLYTGAKVRFADILSADEPTISPTEIERLITPRTRAIIVMHYGGYPCRMGEIMEIAARRNLAIIEDSAHAPGASLAGRPLGAWGDVGCFSFYSNKNLSTGEGGMLVTNREDVVRQVNALRSHGMTSLTWDRHQGHAYTYDVTTLGYNYRIDEIRSAIGLAQLSKLAQNNARRAEITRRYWQALRDTPLRLPFSHLEGAAEISPAYHILPILLPENASRRQFMDEMKANGIQTSIHYPPIHQFSYHRRMFPGASLPQTERFAAREVTLPLYPHMDNTSLDAVIAALHEALVN